MKTVNPKSSPKSHICVPVSCKLCSPGFLANAGPITAGDAQKGGHFVQLCDTRDIPLVFLQVMMMMMIMMTMTPGLPAELLHVGVPGL